MRNSAISWKKQQFCCKTVKECESPTEPGEILNCAARPRIPPFYYQLLRLRTLIDNTDNAKCWSISQLSRSSKDTHSLRQWGNVVSLVDWMNWRNQMLDEGFCATPFFSMLSGPLSMVYAGSGLHNVIRWGGWGCAVSRVTNFCFSNHTRDDDNHNNNNNFFSAVKTLVAW